MIILKFYIIKIYRTLVWYTNKISSRFYYIIIIFLISLIYVVYIVSVFCILKFTVPLLRIWA